MVFDLGTLEPSLGAGKRGQQTSTRNRFMSTNCRDSSARPFFVVTAADRITIFKCYRSQKKNK